ncbi:MAG: phytanoyl-CoA dioxygenase family protein [Anaerolineae bacterium]|nr:phytanoyl-CoA dioxygenase family protein [Phycisphaerae bacterium]
MTNSGDQFPRYRVSVDEYVRFRRDGFLVVPQLVPQSDVDELRRHTDDLMQGKLPEQRTTMSERDVSRDGGVTVQALEAPPAHLSPVEKAQYFLRLHMLHRQLELHERYLLHRRVLDVLEVIVGPDVLALQTMLFLKPPGKPGQGWHQDSYYIPTHPDSLCGAWIALDDADEINGAMWFAKGSGVEPIYPPCPEVSYGFGDRLVGDILHVKGVSDPDDERNSLTEVANRYDQVLAPARAGDVVFFNGHVLHRSKKNHTTDRFRRAFVGHYCNARSFTQWGADSPRGDVHASQVIDPITKMTNGSHILARGDSHLPFAQPRFGSPCAATMSLDQRRDQSEFAARVIAELNNGLLGCATSQSFPQDDHDDAATPDSASSGGYGP